MHLPQRRPRLARGLRVVRRSRDHLQVGLYDDRSALLPRTEAVEHVLRCLVEGRGALEVAGEELTPILQRLEANGCVESDPPVRRARARVAVVGRLEVPGLPDLGELFGAAGVALTSSSDPPDAVLVLSAGELAREVLDPLIRSRTTHLVVRLVDGGAVLGPFVVPGVTACLRCVDAHCSVLDPDHVAVTTRYVRATARPRADGAPDLDPALTAVAVAWAARDLLAHLGGTEPSTWSRTVRLGPLPTRHTEHTWLRHPQCGCCWPVDLGSPGSQPA